MDNKLKNQKIGLITTHYAINYGAVLQAYALHKTISKINGKCEVVDYTPDNKSIGRKIIFKFESIKSIIYSFILFVNFKYRKSHKNKVRKFDNFLIKEFHFSNLKFQSIADLKNNLSEYDILICGSDQIWNLNLFNDEAMFLKFDNILKAKKNISYAPSIAEKMTSNQLEIISKNIKHFSHLSLRESIGIEELSTVSNKKIKHVLDPVFLLEEEHWNEISEPVSIDGPYILLYIIGGAGSYIKKSVDLIRKKLGYKLVYINLAPFDKFQSDLSLNDVSPGQFIFLIKNANFVITSSFHGTAFSAHFGKQFFAYPVEDRSSRHISLLKKIGLEDRLIDDDNYIEKCTSLKNIQYDEIDKIKNLSISDSLLYLKNAINNK
jgi:hypothetical protein